MPKPKRITLIQFLDKVPWNQAFFYPGITASNRQIIRLNSIMNHCPITSVFGGSNLAAKTTAINNGISPFYARMILNAADDYFPSDMSKHQITRTKTIRAMMIQRMKEAGVTIPEGVS